MLISNNKLFWGLFTFISIFISINLIFSFGNFLVNNISVSKLAAVLVSEAEVVNNEGILIPVAAVDKIENIRLAFVGDIMLDRGVKKSVYKNFAGDYAELFSKVKKQLQGYDLLFANLEGPVSSLGEDGGGIYSFRMEPEVIPVLKEAGFDIFSVANNHTFNWGVEAFKDTLKLLSEEEIVYVGGDSTGEGAYQEKIIDISGVSVAFLAFSGLSEGVVKREASYPGLAKITEENIIKSVAEAKKGNDLVIVVYHFGEEYQEEPNAYQRKYAELAIDSGADLIVGYHPHVIQTLEKYKNVYIIYSLGNFIFDQHFSSETMEGGLLELEVNPQIKQIERVILRKVFLNDAFQIEGIK